MIYVNVRSHVLMWKCNLQLANIRMYSMKSQPRRRTKEKRHQSLKTVSIHLLFSIYGSRQDTGVSCKLFSKYGLNECRCHIWLTFYLNLFIWVFQVVNEYVCVQCTTCNIAGVWWPSQTGYSCHMSIKSGSVLQENTWQVR